MSEEPMLPFDLPSTENVVSFQDAKSKRLAQSSEEAEILSPHCAGEAKCMECKHEWVFTAPWPVDNLECPSCGISKGRPKYPYGPTSAESYPICGQCQCEHLRPFFRGGKTYVICENCGQDVTGAFF